MIALSFFLSYFVPGFFISLQDMKTFRISLVMNYLGILSYSVILGLYTKDLSDALWSAVLNIMLYVSVMKISCGGLGLGDVHFSIFCGMFCPGIWMLFSSMAASLSGIVFSVVTRRNKIPFVPFMFAGNVIVFFIRKMIVG